MDWDDKCNAFTFISVLELACQVHEGNVHISVVFLAAASRFMLSWGRDANRRCLEIFEVVSLCKCLTLSWWYCCSVIQVGLVSHHSTFRVKV